MKDFVIKISDIPPFQTALTIEAINGSPYAYLDEDDKVKINVPITGLIAQIGSSTASICRLNNDQYLWLMSLPQVVELGSGDPYIKELIDVTWIGQGKGLYHAIHVQTPFDIDDGDGGTMRVTPPELHCILAS